MISRLLLALSLVVCTLLLSTIGAALRDSELARLREQRFHTLIGELREKIETDLYIGLELSDTSRTQGLLEEVASRTPQLLSVEVVSDQGISLFNSDRGLRGQPTPPSWVDASHRSPNGWQVDRQDERSLGVPLRDSTGQSVGQLVLTHRVAAGGTVHTVPLVSGLLYGTAASLILLTVVAWQERRNRRDVQNDMIILTGQTEDAPIASSNTEFPSDTMARKVDEIRTALDRIDRKARLIARTDP